MVYSAETVNLDTLSTSQHGNHARESAKTYTVSIVPKTLTNAKLVCLDILSRSSQILKTCASRSLLICQTV